MSVLEASRSYKPFKYEWAVKMAEESERNHWVESEINLAADVADYQNKLNPFEKNLVHQILRLFTESDKTVSSMYVTNLIPLFKNNEIQQMLISFANREQTHQRFYSLLNQTLNLPDTDFEAFLSFKEMKDKIDFMNGVSPDTLEGTALDLVRNIFSEGVSLFSQFVLLINFSRRGLMRGMTDGNLWSILDENQHCDGLIKLFRTYIDENPQIVNDAFKKHVYDMARKVYELESEFINLAFALGPVEGITPEETKLYNKYLVDRRLISMGFKGEFGVKDNPLPWFQELVGSPAHENFFENTVVSYSKGGLSGSWEDAW